MIVYSKFSGSANAAIGKLETPIKMVIEHESDLLSKKGGVCDWLFNVEKWLWFIEKRSCGMVKGRYRIPPLTGRRRAPGKARHGPIP